MRIYKSSRAKRKRFHRRSELQMIWLICSGHVFFFIEENKVLQYCSNSIVAAMLVYQSCTPTWRLHTKLYKFA